MSDAPVHSPLISEHHGPEAQDCAQKPETEISDTEHENIDAKFLENFGKPKRASQPPKLEGYEFKEKLGQGGMGTVWLAKDEKLERHVAIKVLHDKLRGLYSKFEQEAKHAVKLDGSKYSATVYDFKREGDTAYLVTEYIKGCSVADILAVAGHVDVEKSNQWYQEARRLHLDKVTNLKDSVPPWDVSVILTQQAAEALDKAHLAGVVHCDIKPTNLMVTEQGNIKVIDFGIAKGRDLKKESDNTPQGFEGTYHYAAPEQFDPEPGGIGPHTDVYALGATFFEFLTNRKPFEGMSYQERLEAKDQLPPKTPHELNPKVPKALSAIAMKALNPDPNLRFDSAYAFEQTLKKEPAGAGSLRYEHKLKKREKVAWALGGIVLICLMALSLLWGKINLDEVVYEKQQSRLTDAYSKITNHQIQAFVESHKTTIQDNCFPEAALPRLVVRGSVANDQWIFKSVTTRPAPDQPQCVERILNQKRNEKDLDRDIIEYQIDKDFEVIIQGGKQ